jgi:enediyne biosynthesis protein E4
MVDDNAPIGEDGGMRRLPLLLLVCMTACGDDPSTPVAPSAPGLMRDVHVAAGLDVVLRSGEAAPAYIPEVKGLGVAAADFDGDGRVDLLFASGSSVERYRRGEAGFGIHLFKNTTTREGAPTFKEVPGAGGIVGPRWPSAPAVADYDGDGDLDVLITGFGGLALWRNRGDGTFDDATTSAGVTLDGWSTGAAFADLDADGDLDFYVARYLAFDPDDPLVHGPKANCTWKDHVVLCGPRGFAAQADRAYRNRGDGTFEDATSAWGFDRATPQYGLGVLIRDFDGDGAVDVFVANDSCANFLFVRRGSGFEEVALESGVAYSEDGRSMAGMGVDAADLNRDGLPDLVVTNFSDQPNSVFLSTGKGRWLESSRLTGMSLASWPMVAWGAAFADFDRDGDDDLLVGNGHVYPQADLPGTDTSFRQRPQLFLTETAAGSFRFVDAVSALDEKAAAPCVGRAVATADFDRDGDMDAVLVGLGEAPRLLDNGLASRGGSVALRLRDSASKNREGLGAEIAWDGALAGRSIVRRSHSFFASSDAEVLPTVPRGTTRVQVDVRWPDGVVEVFDISVAERRRVLERGTGRTK